MATWNNSSKNTSNYKLKNISGIANWDDSQVSWDASLFTWDATVNIFSNKSKNTSSWSNKTQN